MSFTVEDTNNTVVSVDTNTPAGTYTIIPGGVTSSNYTISYTNGTLLILPAILTVSADSLTNVYGSPMPALTWSYQGFVNGEGTNALSGAPSLSTNLSSGSPVAGSPYTITITNGTLSATNYFFTTFNGTFTVLPAPLIVSADNKTNVYGSPMPALTGSMVGVTNNDPLSVSFITSRPRTATSALTTFCRCSTTQVCWPITPSPPTRGRSPYPAPLLVTANNQTPGLRLCQPHPDPCLQRICPQ